MKTYQQFAQELRNLWEGCVDFDDAIQMIGAPDYWCDELCREWCDWDRKLFETGR